MNRPKIEIRKNKLDQGIEILTFALILISAILIGIYYRQLPDELPIYFNWPSKDKSGVGAKELLWACPLIFGILVIVLYRLIRYPRIFNYPTEITGKQAMDSYRTSARMLRILGLLIGLMCLLLSLSSILNGLGNKTDFGKYLYPVFPILLVVVPILYLIKLRRRK